MDKHAARAVGQARTGAGALVLGAMLVSCAPGGQVGSTMNTPTSTVPAADTIVLPSLDTWPLVACTPTELKRLRTAWQSGDGDAFDAVAARVRAAEAALTQEVAFPPEGGQHNQWYQCDVCQIALKTVDDTHHQCPTCGVIYSGYPYDQVVYERRHYKLSRDMEASAWAFAITQAPRFAQHARQILLGYSQRYLQYPLHSANQGNRDDPLRASAGHVFEQTLNEAVWAEEVAAAFDLVRPALSDDDVEAVRSGLLRPLYENIDKHHAGKSNWQTFHNSAFLYLGALLQDVEIVQQALLDPDNGFAYQTQVSVLPGGMWYENSWSYHFYTLTAIERTLETARRLGIDLYSVPQVKDMYTVALDYQMVDDTLPRFGDATTTKIPSARYESAWHNWREPAFGSLLSKNLTFEAVLYGREAAMARVADGATGSLLKEGPGHAVLRLNGSNGPASAVLAFGPFGGFHGHFDKLSFVSFDLGRELAHDPGRARSQAYRLPVHANWYRATLSHNTVLVDRVSQEGAAGEFEFFVDTEDLAAAVARSDSAYPGIQHRRLLLLRPGYLLVADELHASDGQDHTFDWLYHQRADSVTSLQATTLTDITAYGSGFEYIDDARTGTTTDLVRASFNGDTDRTEVHVDGVGIDGSGQVEVLTGTGVGETIDDRVPLLHVTRRGTQAHFAAVVEAVPAGSSAAVVDVTMQAQSSQTSAAGNWTITVQFDDGGEEVFDHRLDGAQRSVHGTPVIGQLACVRRNADGSVQTLATAAAP